MKWLLTLLLPFLVACGDKVPQSEAAKRVGSAPKELIDKASTDAARAVQQGEQRTRDSAD